MSAQALLPTSPQTRWFDPVASILLLLALQIAASQLIVTNWDKELTIIWVVVLFGGLLGLALGYSTFPPAIVIILAALYSVFVVPWRLGMNYSHRIEWIDRLSSMYDRLNVAIYQVTHGQNVIDSILFLVVLAVLAWFLSVYAAYTLTRHGRVWQALLPVAVIMIIVETYGHRFTLNAWLIGIFILLTLLLVARLSFLRQDFQWSGLRTSLPYAMGSNMMRSTLLAAGLLILLAWSIPALASFLPSAEGTWTRITAPLNGIRESLRRAVAPLNTSLGLLPVTAASDYYGNTLSLGSGNFLSDEVIFTAEAPAPTESRPRYYWRARYYDNYMDGGWSTTSTETEIVTPDGFNLGFPEFTGRQDIKLQITSHKPLATLFSPPQPQWVDRPVEVELVYYPNETVDLVRMKATPLLNVGEVYEVHAAVSNVTVAELRTAGMQYPQWIEDRYLQLSPTITPRTLNLAQQIAEGLDNPYEITEAVTEYLRRNIEYQEVLPPVPQDQEPLDWMLFDLRQGYCNYYASAEIVLLRSLGIPARLAVGYAQGQEFPSSDLYPEVGSEGNLNLAESGGVQGDLMKYQVRQREAHAWPEVYFPGIGWVEFEPTVSEEPLVRPVGVMPAEDSSSEADGAQDEQAQLERDLPLMDDEVDQFQSPDTEAQSGLSVISIPWELVFIAGVVLFLLLLVGMYRIYDWPPVPVVLVSGFESVGLRPPAFLRRWAIRTTLLPAASAYHELNRALTRLGNTPGSETTPAERAASLAEVLPEAEESTSIVLTQYNIFAYSPHSGYFVEAIRAGRDIRRLSYKAWLQRLFTRDGSR